LNHEIKYKRFVCQILRKDGKNECSTDLMAEEREGERRK
jgi:hypothetical protein